MEGCRCFDELIDEDESVDEGCLCRGIDDGVEEELEEDVDEVLRDGEGDFIRV